MFDNKIITNIKIFLKIADNRFLVKYFSYNVKKRVVVIFWKEIKKVSKRFNYTGFIAKCQNC